METAAKVENIRQEGGNIHFSLSCPFTSELKIDQSLAHNGCCLTVVEISESRYAVTAIRETLEKTNLGKWQVGTLVNVERCTKADGRLDGHIVQGHVDTTGEVVSIEDKDGSHYITIKYADQNYITVPQGSITVNGVSLTVADSADGQFSVAIIPYTWNFTNMSFLKIGDTVNLEFDIVGKYISKLLEKRYGGQ